MSRHLLRRFAVACFVVLKIGDPYFAAASTEMYFYGLYGESQ